MDAKSVVSRRRGRASSAKKQKRVYVPVYVPDVQKKKSTSTINTVVVQTAKLTAQSRPLAVNIALPALCRSCSCSTGTDGQTDRRTDARQLHRPRSTYYAGSVKIVIVVTFIVSHSNVNFAIN